MENLIFALMLWASAFTGHPVPDTLPTIKLAAHCDIQAIAYEGTRECDPDEGVIAVYLHERDVIYLPDTWTPTNHQDISTLLHELVHFVQDQAGYNFNNVKCPALELEAPAYAATKAYLEAAGLDFWKITRISPLYLHMMLQCDQPTW